MKIINKYKNLKTGAKRLFIALLTISLVFGTTGVGTVIASANTATQDSVAPDMDNEDKSTDTASTGSDTPSTTTDPGSTQATTEPGTTDPGEPPAPDVPSGTETPDDPGTGDPSTPADPSSPTDPSDPADPSDPLNPTDPTDPANPTDPTDPANPGETGDEEDPKEDETQDPEADKDKKDKDTDKKKEDPEKLKGEEEEKKGNNVFVGGTINVGDYSSSSLSQSSKVEYILPESTSIEIKAFDPDDTEYIEYFISEKKYYTISDIEGAVADKKETWKSYYGNSEPTTPTNKKFYVYARTISSSGDASYVSTAALCHDKIKPTVDTLLLAAKNPNEKLSTENILAAVATDTISGVDAVYMKYELKTGDNKTPLPADVLENGTRAEIEVLQDNTVGAKLELSGLYADKDYIFYAVAKDKAGNISDVKVFESKGKGKGTEAAVAAASGNATGGNASGSAAATAPPNGIASPAAAAAIEKAKAEAAERTKAREEAKAKAEAEAAKKPATALDQEINRKPYISDSTGDVKIGLETTGGWDKIENEVKNAPAGVTIDVEMAGLSKIPSTMFGAMAGKDIDVKFLMPNDIEWLIKGSNVPLGSAREMDLGVVLGVRNIPDEMLGVVVRSFPHTEFEIKYDGELGFPATMSIPLDKTNADMFANLYYYDTAQDELVFIDSSRIRSDGVASFTLTHASDYSVVIRPEDMRDVVVTEVVEQLLTTNNDQGNVTVSGLSSYDATKVSLISPEVFGSDKAVKIWLFTIAIISLLLCAAILFMPGLQIPEETKVKNRR